MATSDIPEYVEVAAGDLIRADQWNNVQRQTRSSLRTHRHTHEATKQRDDTATTDEADQINTAEIADRAVTAAKIARNSIDTPHLKDSAVTSAKLSFEVFRGTLTLTAILTPTGIVTIPVKEEIPNTMKKSIYFPTLAITGSSGSEMSSVHADMIYRQEVGAETFSVYIRFTNLGQANAIIDWEVLALST